MAATPVAETAEQRCAKLEKQLQASQAELLAAKVPVGWAGGTPATAPTAAASAGAGPPAGAPTPVAGPVVGYLLSGLVGISGRAMPPPPAYVPAAVPAPTPVHLPMPVAAPSVAGVALGPMPLRGPTAAQLEQQARAQQIFPGATCTSLLGSLASAEAAFVDGPWTPTQFWDWVAQGNAGMAQKEQATLQFGLDRFGGSAPYAQ